MLFEEMYSSNGFVMCYSSMGSSNTSTQLSTRNLRTCPEVHACIAGKTERPHDVARAADVIWFT